jgi:hypothetical protein
MPQWCWPLRRQQAGRLESLSWAENAGPISEKLNKATSMIAARRRIAKIVHPTRPGQE